MKNYSKSSLISNLASAFNQKYFGGKKEGIESFGIIPAEDVCLLLEYSQQPQKEWGFLPNCRAGDQKKVNKNEPIIHVSITLLVLYYYFTT